MSPTTNLTTPPTAWPQVTVGGRTYELRFDQLTYFLASEWHCSMGSLIAVATNQKATIGEAYSSVLKLWALFAARNFKSPEVPLTGEQWALALPDEDDFTTWKVMHQGVINCLAKHLADRTAKQAAANPNPPNETTGQPNLNAIN